jgi:DNA topoisomerase-1
MKLLIVESPSKCKAIEGYLGPGWIVKASMGHVRDLPANEMGVDGAPDFGAHYELTERGRSVVANLKKLAATAEEVYLATDPDREGEAISWHLLRALGLTSYQRVTFSEITKTGIAKGMSGARQLDMRLVAAQEARRVLDRLAGYTVSPELSRLLAQRLSAGRVQSPALKLLVLREREIRGFTAKKHLGVKAFFPGAAGVWTAEWDFSPLLDKGVPQYWTDRAFAEQVAAQRAFQVEACSESVSESAPPAPFTTSTLQQAASVALGMDPKETMRHAQSLFEKGLITYMRTDNPNLSDEAIAKVLAYAKEQGLPARGPRKFKAKEGAQEAHEAIRPTDFWLEAGGTSADEIALYGLIRTRAICSQLANAEFDVRTVTLSTGPVHGNPLRFKAVGRVLRVKGWKALMAEAQENEDSEDAAAANPVPRLAVGTALTAERCELLEKTTVPPPRYTQASLVKKLEAEGIGRPSTYAAIIDGLMTRNYAVIEKKKMKATPLGEEVIDVLDGRFEFLDLRFTREMESDLDAIAEGRSSYKSVVGAFHSRLMSDMSSLAGVAAKAPVGEKPCPACGKSTLRKIKGPRGFFLGCRGFPECKYTENLPDAAPAPAKTRSRTSAKTPPKPGAQGANPAKDSSQKSCSACGKPMVLRNGAGGKFWGCSGFPACRNTERA